MFEAHIEQTLALYTDWSIGAAEDILFRDVASSALPPSIKRFYEREAEVRVAEERSRLLTSPHFRYSDDAILHHFDAIVDAAREYALFTREEFLALLDTAVKLRFNYICRPQWTLARYLFGDAENAPAGTLLDGMSVFVEYGYYRAVLSEYFERKSIGRMHRERFEELIRMIDDEMVRSSDGHALAEVAEPLFGLFTGAGATLEPRVPIEALAIYFEDKGVRAITEQLEEERAMRSDMSREDFIALLNTIDLDAAADISDIVTRHVHGDDQPGQAVLPDQHRSAHHDESVPLLAGDTDADLSDAMVRSDAFIDTGDHFTTEHALDEDELFDEETFVFTRDTPVIPAEYDAEPVPGEQVTPDFGLEDPLNFGSEPSTIDGEYDLSLFEDVSTDGTLAESITPPGSTAAFPAFDPTSTPDLAQPNSAALDSAELDITDPAIAITAPFAAAADDHDGNAPGLLAGAADADTAASLDIDTEGGATDSDPFLEALNLTDEDFLPPSKSTPAQDVPAAADPFTDEIPDFELPDEKNELVGDRPAPPTAQAESVDAYATTASADEVIARIGDLRSVIPSGERKRYIKKIFNRNEEAYERAIDAMNARGTWREASELIDDIFISFNVDMYSRIAVKFTDDIYRRYVQNKG